VDYESIPKCRHCGIRLLVGFIPGSFVQEIKEQTGWKVLGWDKGVSEQDADAAMTGCIVYNCPRCEGDLTEQFAPKEKRKKGRKPGSDTV
jgi:hypothetical protein